MMRISYSPPSFGPLLLGVLASAVAALALSAAPALAATGNAYRSQFNGGETAAKFFYPAGLAFNASGDVFVSDDEHNVLDEFNPTGATVEHEFNGDGTPAESFVAPGGSAVNKSGDVFAADREREVVYEFGPDGKLLREIKGGKTKAESFFPFSVAVNSSGDLYVTDLEHGVVDEFEPAAFESAPTGAPIKEISVSEPAYIAIDASSGDLYVSGAGVLHEFEPDGTLLEFNGSGTPQGSSFSPGPVAVAPSGEVYVSDYLEATEHSVVDRFSSTGTYLSQFGGDATPQGSFSPGAALAVNASEEVYVSDGAHHVVDLFSKPVPLPAVTTGPASEETPTSATLTGSIEPTTGLEASCEFRYGTTTSYGSTAPCVPAGPFSAFTEVHADISGLQQKTTYHYRLEGTTENGTTVGEDQTFTTAALLPPTATIEPVTAVTAHSAILNAGVNPEGYETTYRFEGSTDGVHWRSLGEANAGSGTAEVPVTQTVSNLAGSTTYDVRLVAENAGGSVTSGEETFPTPAASPQIFGAGASDITATQATLTATIYPESQATTYRFEYGPTATYGSSVPAGEGEAGSSTPSQVSQTLTGLAPDTTYHFRVVATNATEPPTTTSDQRFTTKEGEPVAAGGCPNEALRAESNVNPRTHLPYSAQLPDCRAYEQVTPRFKNGAEIGARAAGGLSGIKAISDSGSPLVAKSASLWEVPGADPVETGELLTGAFYELKREPATGWAVGPLNAPSAQLPFQQLAFVSPSDTATGLWFGATPTQPLTAADIYRREPDGQFVNVGPLAPPSTATGPPRGASLSPDPKAVEAAQTQGASKDLSYVLFGIHTPDHAGTAPDELWAGDGTTLNSENGVHYSLYEYSGSSHTGEGSDVPALVGVDNAGVQITQCGTATGAAKTIGERLQGNTHNAVSDAGSTVFFNAQAGGCVSGATGPNAAQLYARIGIPGTTQTTVNVAASSGCNSSASCNITKPVSYAGASSDGSKVFFTTSQALLAGDKDTTNDIYECELPGDGGTTPTPTGIVNACPDLKGVSVTGTSSGANVQSVVAVSEDGTHVYFTATGILTTVPNGQGRSAQAGKDNLYLWEAPSEADPTGRTAFISTLTLPQPSQEEAQITPDGRYLVFTSTADLTIDDTSTVAQAFRYDAQTGKLTRISTGQDGFDSDGNTDRYPARLAPVAELGGARELGTTISEDGSYVVFESSDALTPQVQGGLHNVYEWHAGTVSLISDGVDATANTPQPYVGLVGMDASGANIFFTTKDKLLGQDTDETVDVYDARFDGGFPKPVPPPGCSGEVCQGPFSSSLVPPLLGSTSAPAIGNAPPPTTQASGSAGKVEITKHSVKGPTITLVIEAPTKGHLSESGFGLTTVRKSLTKAGTYTLKVSLTKAGKASLRRRHRLKVKIKVAFTPTSGEASSETITMTLKT